jgi:iron(III) transport system ATP-binding protein
VIGAPDVDGQTLVSLADGQRVMIKSDKRPSLGDKVTFAYRPEQMRLAKANDLATGGSIIDADVVSHSYIGGRWQIGLNAGGNQIRIETQDATTDHQLRLWLPLTGGILFTERNHGKSH